MLTISGLKLYALIGSQPVIHPAVNMRLPTLQLSANTMVWEVSWSVSLFY